MRAFKHSLQRGVAARRGFTLTEVMVASTLGLLVLAAVLSVFLFLTKSSLRLGQYSDMEAAARRALHQFSQDARQASAATWTSVNTLNLTVNGATVVYTYDGADRDFTRTENGGTPQVLAANISSFSFKAFQATGTALDLTPSTIAAAGAVTKMVQINMGLEQKAGASTNASSQIISARSVLRNKPTS